VAGAVVGHDDLEEFGRQVLSYQLTEHLAYQRRPVVCGDDNRRLWLADVLHRVTPPTANDCHLIVAAECVAVLAWIALVEPRAPCRARRSRSGSLVRGAPAPERRSGP